MLLTCPIPEIATLATSLEVGATDWSADTTPLSAAWLEALTASCPFCEAAFTALIATGDDAAITDAA